LILNQLSKLDPMAQMVAIPYFMDNPEKKRKELEALLPTLENFLFKTSRKAIQFWFEVKPLGRCNYINSQFTPKPSLKVLQRFVKAA